GRGDGRVGPAREGDPRPVAQGGRAGGVGADVVALHEVEWHGGATAKTEVDAIELVAGDDVPGAPGKPPDGGGKSIRESYPRSVAQGGRAGGVGADVVALYQAIASGEGNPSQVIPGDDGTAPGAAPPARHGEGGPGADVRP